MAGTGTPNAGAPHPRSPVWPPRRAASPGPAAASDDGLGTWSGRRGPYGAGAARDPAERSRRVERLLWLLVAAVTLAGVVLIGAIVRSGHEPGAGPPLADPVDVESPATGGDDSEAGVAGERAPPVQGEVGAPDEHTGSAAGGDLPSGGGPGTGPAADGSDDAAAGDAPAGACPPGDGPGDDRSSGDHGPGRSTTGDATNAGGSSSDDAGDDESASGNGPPRDSAGNHEPDGNAADDGTDAAESSSDDESPSNSTGNHQPDGNTADDGAAGGSSSNGASGGLSSDSAGDHEPGGSTTTDDTDAGESSSDGTSGDGSPRDSTGNHAPDRSAPGDGTDAGESSSDGTSGDGSPRDSTGNHAPDRSTAGAGSARSDGGVADGCPPGDSTSEDEPDAPSGGAPAGWSEVARGFGLAFTRTSVGQEAWFAAMSSWLTPEQAAEYRDVPIDEIPTGELVEVDVREPGGAAHTRGTLTYDTGMVLEVGLSHVESAGGWLVARVSLAGSDTAN